MLLLALSSCTNPTYKALRQIRNTEFNNEADLLTAKKAIGFIEDSQLDSLKAMFSNKIVAATDDKVWENIIIQGKKAINLSIMPPDSLVKISSTVTLNNGSQQVFTKLSFPYGIQREDTKKKYININTSKGLLFGLFISDYPFGMRIIEPKHSEPHLAKHSLSYNQINWFRIWYGSGYQHNKYGGRYGYYAVSGDKKKLDKLGIEKEMSNLFTLINNAKIDSIDFKYLRDKDIGDPEFIYLRFKFDNDPYKNFGEFSIYYYLSEEPDKQEIMSKYIILKHSNKTRYLLLKDDNPEIVKLLESIAYRKYKNIEKRWR